VPQAERRLEDWLREGKIHETRCPSGPGVVSDVAGSPSSPKRGGRKSPYQFEGYRPPKPVRSCNPRLGRFDSCAAPVHREHPANGRQAENLLLGSLRSRMAEEET
jgi:hypothetical protein